MRCSAGFTLLELLAVIAIIALLAAILLPVLTVAKAQGKRTQCVNNLKNVSLASQMYTADYEGKLAGNLPMDTDSNAWVAGNLKLTPDSTNKTLILRCKFFPYSSQLGTYRCPSDSSETGGTPRTRSYSMNSWVGSRFMETNEFKQNDFRTFVSDGEIAAAGASRIWVLIDEHESTIDDGLFMVTMDDRQPFASAPAMRHNRGYTLTFGDGHVEYFALRDPNSAMIATAPGQVSAKNTDWLRLKQLTTIR